MLTVSERDIHLSQAVGYGVSGYLTKNADPNSIIKAVRDVANGEAAFSSNVTGKLMEVLNPMNQKLTRKEKRVLNLAGDGLNNTQIGKELDISEVTVRSHLSSIMKKLNLENRTKIVAYAIENDLTSS